MTELLCDASVVMHNEQGYRKQKQTSRRQPKPDTRKQLEMLRKTLQKRGTATGQIEVGDPLTLWQPNKTHQ
jgi:hypothetical protein